MNRKYISIALIILLLGAIIYYVTNGSEQITAQMKKQVNRELTSLQHDGFSVQDRHIEEKQEHFIISFDEPKKIADFLNRQGLQLNMNDAELFKGLQVGVDVNYLSDTYSVLSFDMYPVSLPNVLTHASLSSSEKEALAQVQNMLEKKTFLLHVAINKLGNGFKGYMKDIQEVLHGEQDVNLSIKGFTFFGDITDDSLQSVTQTLEKFSVQVPDEFTVLFQNLHSQYTITGDSAYDYETNYDIEDMQLYARSQFNIQAKDITAKSDSYVKNGLLSGSTLSKIKTLKLDKESQSYRLQDLDFSIKAKNLDAEALDKLQEANVYNEQEMNVLLQTLISKGIHIEIPSLSIGKITDVNGQTIDGFHLNANADIDKSLNIASLPTDPVAALRTVDADIHLELSPAFYSLIAQQPQAIMIMMLFQPQDVNGSKVYDLKLKDGTPTVNGLPLL